MICSPLLINISPYVGMLLESVIQVRVVVGEPHTCDHTTPTTAGEREDQSGLDKVYGIYDFFIS